MIRQKLVTAKMILTILFDKSGIILEDSRHNDYSQGERLSLWPMKTFQS